MLIQRSTQSANPWEITDKVPELQGAFPTLIPSRYRMTLSDRRFTVLLYVDLSINYLHTPQIVGTCPLFNTQLRENYHHIL